LRTGQTFVIAEALLALVADGNLSGGAGQRSTAFYSEYVSRKWPSWLCHLLSLGWITIPFWCRDIRGSNVVDQWI